MDQGLAAIPMGGTDALLPAGAATAFTGIPDPLLRAEVPGGTAPPVVTGDDLRRALMHEARTALVPVIGFAEVLDSHQYSAEVRELARYIKVGGQHLELLIDDLVMLGEISGGPARLSPHATLPEVALREAAQALAPAAELARVAVTRGEIVQRAAQIDSLLLSRALKILLWTAIHSTRAGHAVEISAACAAPHIAINIRGGSPFTSAAEMASDPWANILQVSPLGIRLVVAIAQRHGGTLVLHKPERASFDATLMLPAQG